jgi:hypothetical protein
VASPRNSSGLERLRPSAGYGPLYQRDYWARIVDCALAPSRFGELLARRFCELVPPGLATFRRCDGSAQPLEVGDDLEVTIRFAGTCRVRVLHKDDNSLTFAAYRHADGDVIFHVRSRARAASPRYYAGFVALGSAMQANTWCGLIERVASATGTGVADFVYEETALFPDEDAAAEEQPTFVAEGD